MNCGWSRRRRKAENVELEKWKHEQKEKENEMGNGKWLETTCIYAFPFIFHLLVLLSDGLTLMVELTIWRWQYMERVCELKYYPASPVPGYEPEWWLFPSSLFPFGNLIVPSQSSSSKRIFCFVFHYDVLVKIGSSTMRVLNGSTYKASITPRICYSYSHRPQRQTGLKKCHIWWWKSESIIYLKWLKIKKNFHHFPSIS